MTHFYGYEKKTARVHFVGLIPDILTGAPFVASSEDLKNKHWNVLIY